MSKGWRIAVAAAFVAWAGTTAYQVMKTGNYEERDIVRNWVVGRYVVAGRDPYDLSKAILVAEYGVGNPDGKWVSRIPEAIPEERRAEVIPELGPPEATYPPGTLGFYAVSISLLSEPDVVLYVWFVLNLLLTFALAALLARLWPTPPTPPGPGGNFWWILLAVVAFTPAFATLERAQFSMLVMCLMLIADDPRFPWPARGVALAVGLLKPSVCLPLALLPLVHRQWRVLATAAAVQVASIGYVSWKVGREPIGMFRDWMAVSRYFLSAGMYTVQEWVLPLSTRAPWIVPAVPLAILVAFAGTLWAFRDAPRARLFSLAGVTAVFWTYHGTYDAVFLLPMLLRRMGWTDGPTPRTLSKWGVALLLVLSVAYMDRVVGSPAPYWHACRWAVRVGMIGLFLLEYVDMIRDFRPRLGVRPRPDAV